MKLPLLINPKPAKSDDTRRSCWYRFYAMFSERFAKEVLTIAGLPAGSVVLDPWLGVGTTTAVAARSGMRTVGVDINPAMVIVASGRCIDRSTAEAAVEKAEWASSQMTFPLLPKADPLFGWFGRCSAGALREWQRLVLSMFPQNEHPQQAGLLLTALFEAAWKLAEPYRTKNPTWVKKPTAMGRADCPALEVSKSVLELARKKATDCHRIASAVPTIQLGTSTRLVLPASHVDFVLTSPPYCTRIDYAVSTRIELAVLGYDDAAVAELRDATMGTSTIRRTGMAAEKLWGPTCTDLLAQIRLHPSKSSANYYYKTFIQYFADLYASLGELNRCLKPGAGAVIVVQDSRYKGMRVDLAGIVTEMATSMRWALSRRDDYDVAQTMRLVNTRSRQYHADATSVESVLWFTTPNGG
jgi:ubiquinone/menaquinone biosynthesis C-methylase UbiE